MEESYWRQQARIKWRVDGDRNTKMFHHMVKRKRYKNRIMSIEQDGNLITEPGELHDSAVEYFERVLADNITLSEEPDLSIIPQFVNEEINT